MKEEGSKGHSHQETKCLQTVELRQAKDKVRAADGCGEESHRDREGGRATGFYQT